MGERCVQGLVGKSEGKRPLGRPRIRWEGNINADLQEVGYGCIDLIELAQDGDMWWECGNETSGSIKCSKFLD
jgi:hypothetical protein